MRNALSMLVPPIVVDPTSFRLHTRAARGLPEAYLRGIFCPFFRHDGLVACRTEIAESPMANGSGAACERPLISYHLRPFGRTMPWQFIGLGYTYPAVRALRTPCGACSAPTLNIQIGESEPGLWALRQCEGSESPYLQAKLC